MTNITLPVLDYREYQLPLVRYMQSDIPRKRAVVIMHRRAGKDVMCWQVIVEMAIQEKGLYYYCLPEYNQSRRVVWDAIMNNGMTFLDLIPKELVTDRNESQMKITLVNGSIIQLVGSDQYDRLVGTNPKGIVFSEFSITHPMAWQIMRPMLAMNGGWAIFNGTPRGKNHLWDILNTAKENKDWYHCVLTADDTKILSKEILEDERRQMDHDVFLQEYYASFDAAIKGAYYTEHLAAMRQQGRLCKVPYETKLPVYTAFDPGDSTTAIVFFQVVGKEIRIIDAHESYNPSVESIYSYLTSKPYTYGRHFLPFDASVHQMASGMSISTQLIKLGLQNVYVPDKPEKSKMDGIMQVKSAFASFWIDEKLEKTLVESLANYAPKFYEKRNSYSDEPDHNWASHFCDAVRYLVINLPSLTSNFTSKAPRIAERRSIIRRSGIR